ncbi:MAG: terminase, partial [Pusillimonas sp.]|nr:terminase [Pusillimonas sp.]
MPIQNNAGYLGNALVKRDGVEHNFTKEEVVEYAKCMKDPVYFAENYIKVISLDKGLVPFKPYDYQRKMFKHFDDNRFSIILACRQSGKSISSIIYILWYVCFHADKTVAILANKGATAREMLGRITLALENLPHFLQPGCKELNKGSIGFSNNSKIIASATSASS